MPETIFIRMLGNGGQVRESYQDLYHMIELSGYKTCLLNEVDFQSDNTYICTFKDGLAESTFSSKEAKERKCRVILWQLEWAEWRNGVLEFPAWEHNEFNVLWMFDWCDEIWVSDLYFFEMIRRFNPRSRDKTRFIVLGGHPDFGKKDDVEYEPLYDFCHYMYLTGPRGHKFQILQDIGFKMAPNCWGKDREHGLLHSRWGLNLHQNPFPVITPQRFMLFASYKLPIVTDYCANPFPFKVFQDGLIHWDPRKSSVMNKELRDEAVEHNYRVVTHWFSFRKEVDRRINNPVGQSGIQSLIDTSYPIASLFDENGKLFYGH